MMPIPFRSRFLDSIGMIWPIIQAPMAGVSTPEMAAAVSNAGGLGSLAIGAMSDSDASDSVTRFRKLSSGPLNLNVFCHAPAVEDEESEARWLERLRPQFQLFGDQPPTRIAARYLSFLERDGTLDLLLSHKPEVVSFHFGLPQGSWIRRLKAEGIVLFATVTQRSEADAAIACGIDALVAQGYEAGGHRGIFDPDGFDEKLSTMELVRRLREEQTLPIIAAGGIMGGADIAAALGVGASAAQLGTAFLATEESAIEGGFRAALEGEATANTVMTRVISGRPSRCLVNRFTKFGEGIPAEDVPAYPIAYDAGKYLHAAAVAQGEYGYGAQWAGEGVSKVRAMPTAQLMAQLIKEWECARTQSSR